MKSANLCDSCQSGKYEAKKKLTFFAFCCCAAGGYLLYWIFVWIYGLLALKYGTMVAFKSIVGGILLLNWVVRMIKGFDWDSVFD